jgi:high-affinity iron transporter
MNRHGSELAAQMRRVGADVESGRRPPFALLLVVALAVLREGSEIVLFLFGVGIGESGRAAMLGGAALGLASGALVGALLYSGLLRIPVRRFFAATNALILLLAAGMSAQAARFLLQADLLPALGQRVWDTSALLSEQSLVGHALKALVGYDARPAGIQVLFYLATLILILLGTRRWAMRPAAPATTAAAPLTSTGPVARA